MKCVCHIVAIFAGVIIIDIKEVVCELPASPCRSIFTYKTKNDTGEAYGYLRFPNDLSGDYQLEIRMSVAKRTNDSIIIFRLPTEDDIQCGKDLEYEVYFPDDDVIPTLTYVKYNGKIYCTGTPARGSIPQAVTQLKEYDALVTELNHTCYIQIYGTTPVTTAITTRPVETTTIHSPKSEGCGILQESTVGGREHYPWLATIYYPDNTTTNYSTNYMCSGTLISNSHIVTAAMCMPPSFVQSNITIRLGWNNIKTGLKSSSQHVLRQILRKVKSISSHPGYIFETRILAYNIAIMEFTEPVEFDDLISPICLWTGSIKLDDIVFQIGSIIGWDPDAKPKKFSAPIIPHNSCVRSHSVYQTLLDSTSFCAGYRNGSMPCLGNNGGPLILKKEDGRYYLRGIASAGLMHPRGGCDKFTYTLFTDVAQFGSWIHSIIDASKSTK